MATHSERNSKEFVSKLYKDTHKILYNFILRRTSSKHDAQDLTQEAYLRLIRVDKKELILQPKAYLFQIASNLVYEHRIKNNKSIEKYTVSIEDTSDEFEGVNLEHDNEIADALVSLGKVVSELPPIYRSVLLLRKRDGFSHKQIAKKLDISIHTVRKYMTKAIAQCRKNTVVDSNDE